MGMDTHANTNRESENADGDVASSNDGQAAEADGQACMHRWLAEHGAAMQGMARRLLGPSQDVCDDVLQDTLLAAWEGRKRFEGRSSERTWLLAILRHKAIDTIRREARQSARQKMASRNRRANDSVEATPVNAPVATMQATGAMPGLPTWFDARGRWKHPVPPVEAVPSDAPGPEQAMQQTELVDALTGCIHRLPPTLNESVVLKQLLEQPAETVCDTLGITADNLWTRLHRAKLALLACLKKLGHG